VAGISGLHVSLVERIEPDDIAVLVAGLRIREGMASLFREIPQKGKVVRGWTVVREDQKEAGVDLLKRLMQQESRLPEVTLIM
jgi:Fe-S cluster assembly ATPase SufC